jgi:hypothetical protein
MRQASQPKGPGLMSWWAPLVAGVAVVGLVVILTIVDKGARHPSSATPPVSVPTVKSFASQGHAAASLTQVAAFKYNSTPPTSGPHATVWPTSWKASWPAGARGISQLLTVLQAADVVIAYSPKGVSKTEVTDLKNIAGPFQSGTFDQAVGRTAAKGSKTAVGQTVFVIPWPGLPRGQVAAVAWRHEMIGKNPAGSDLVSFITDYVGNTKNARS